MTSLTSIIIVIRNRQLLFFFEQESDWMWFRGDRVELLTGPDKGKQGYINYIVQVSKTQQSNIQSAAG